MRYLVGCLLLVSAAVAQADPARARTNYLLNCMGCHGETGAGLEGKVPSLRGTLAMLSSSPQGRYYVLRVPGVTQSKLSDAELAEVLNWSLRTFNASTPHDEFPEFTAAEIAAARREPLVDVAASREAALGAAR